MKRSTNWGNNILSFSEELSYLDELPDEISRGIVPFGFGRSYGDSALNSGGLRIHGPKFIKIDEELGIAEAGSYVSMADLEASALRKGLFPAVVPGTSRISLGGAFASDIHGKSHHKIGSFSAITSEIKIQTSRSQIIVADKYNQNIKVFWSTAGGMGLTGLIHSLRIQLARVETSYIYEQNIKVTSLQEMLETMKNLSEDFLYSVSWIDLSGDFKGRGIVTVGRHATRTELPLKLSKEPLAPPKLLELGLPDAWGINVVNSRSIRVFNEVWFQKPIKSRFSHISDFMHPLDKLRNWNLLYGKDGFVQYQFVVPFESSDYIQSVLDRLKLLGVASNLGVLKSFGSKSKGQLSFPIPGWTLAIDFPSKTAGLSKFLVDLDREISAIGGRVYLTKDSRLSAENFNKMYPEAFEWRNIKNNLDPEKIWQSDQGRRLGLC
jgi:decaprenylphospho-beta-D-ribofuranose 2-oxidase